MRISRSVGVRLNGITDLLELVFRSCPAADIGGVFHIPVLVIQTSDIIASFRLRRFAILISSCNG